MPDVQTEHGFTRIADSLFEAILRTPMPGRQKEVVFALIRLTYGFQKTRDRISAGQIAALIGSHERHVRRVLGELVRRRIVIDHTPDATGRPHVLQIQKDFGKWLDHEPDTSRGRRPNTPDTGVTPDTGSPATGVRGTPDIFDTTPDTGVLATPDTRVRHQRQETRPETRERGRKRPAPQRGAPDHLTDEQLEAVRRWCERKHPAWTPHVDAAVESCLDWHRAKGSKWSDWAATCRTWIRRDAERHPNGPPTHAHESPSERRAREDREAVRRVMDRARAREQDEPPPIVARIMGANHGSE